VLDRYEAIDVLVDRGVAFATIDHPPINLLDRTLMLDLHHLGSDLEDAPGDVRAVVLQSANPEFFIAHADVELILQIPREPGPKPRRHGFFHAMVERWRTLPVVTIGVIEGRARGGGSEFALSLDMRFAAVGRAVLGQPEVALGIIPGGSGTQRLARLMGRSRALEMILGCGDADAELAERYGWVNRALPDGELRPFVEALARRIASFPPEAVKLAKEAVDAAMDHPAAGLLAEDHAFRRSAATEEARRRMRAFLDEGGQTRDVELDLAPVLDTLGGSSGAPKTPR
jgi:enoyl-CoA hydratase/carnithine racemase